MPKHANKNKQLRSQRKGSRSKKNNTRRREERAETAQAEGSLNSGSGGGPVTDLLAWGAKKLAPGWTHGAIDLGRKVLHDLTGFAERDSSAMGAGAGQVVTTQEAPIAFPRLPVKMGARLYETDGRIFLHIMDMPDEGVIEVVTAADAGTYQDCVAIEEGTISPASSGLFPNFYYLALPFNKFRLCGVKMHYTHFCSTGTQGSIGLAYDPDAAYVALYAPASTSAAMAYQNAAYGAVYEDLCLTVAPSTLETLGGQDGWISVFDSQAYNADDDTSVIVPNLSSAGGLVVWTDNNSAGDEDTKVGDFFLEVVFELSDMKSGALSGVRIITTDVERLLRAMSLVRNEAQMLKIVEMLRQELNACADKAQALVVKRINRPQAKDKLLARLKAVVAAEKLEPPLSSLPGTALPGSIQAKRAR